MLRFGVKMALVIYLNFSKIAKNFKLIMNVFCPEIDNLLHTSVQFYAEPMTSCGGAPLIPISLISKVYAFS